MVSYKEIQASNALINDALAPRVSVFAGGTSGIGKLTIRALVATGASVRIYLIKGEITLLAETKRVCETIKSKESRIDLLFLTAGYAPFSARKETAEGVEISQSLTYYSRILFILHLLPLLSKAEAPRVVSVLTRGMEWTAIDLDDLDLKKPGNFNAIKTHMHYRPMNTTTMKKLANDNPSFVWLFLNPLIGLLASSDEAAGQRHLFQSTSAAFGGRGVQWKGKPGINSLGKPENGLFLVNYKCDCTPNAKAVSWLREKALKTIWDHTQEVLLPYL
ncbi:hypothetical protein BGZ57DRAFT_974219 [Hyaloscypha finlandica]|nr:hypothetical protein BGZ57DRAFT_974219 [Hyaloscypha finlandica]